MPYLPCPVLCSVLAVLVANCTHEHVEKLRSTSPCTSQSFRSLQAQASPLIVEMLLPLPLLGISSNNPSSPLRDTLPNPADSPPNCHLGATSTPERYLPPFPAEPTYCGLRPPHYLVHFPVFSFIIHSLTHSTIAASRPSWICARMVIQRNCWPNIYCIIEHVPNLLSLVRLPRKPAHQEDFLHQTSGHGDGYAMGQPAHGERQQYPTSRRRQPMFFAFLLLSIITHGQLHPFSIRICMNGRAV